VESNSSGDINNNDVALKTHNLSANLMQMKSVKSCKQRRTLKQMFLDLKELEYEGSCDRVAAFGGRWMREEATKYR